MPLSRKPHCHRSIAHGFGHEDVNVLDWSCSYLAIHLSATSEGHTAFWACFTIHGARKGSDSEAMGRIARQLRHGR